VQDRAITALRGRDGGVGGPANLPASTLPIPVASGRTRTGPTDELIMSRTRDGWIARIDQATPRAALPRAGCHAGRAGRVR
jgi:hypothetical protein